jgi:excisionase family DNA binding protein
LTDATRPATPPRYDDLPDLCTPDDARQFLQVGKNTIYDLIKSGELRSIRFGKLIRIPKTALLANGHGHDRG